MPPKQSAKPGEGAPKSRLEIISLAVSVVSAGLAILNQATGLLGAVDYITELLLGGFALGLALLGVGLLLPRKKARSGADGQAMRRRVLGATLVLLGPVLVFFLWSSPVVLSAAERRQFDDLVQLGDAARDDLNEPEEALNYYRKAHRLAPWNGAARARVREMERMVRGGPK